MAKKIKGLPVFNAEITSDKCRVIRVSLVDAPAVEADFIKYGKQSPVQTYKITDEEKQRVFGCVLRADFPIFRRDEDGTEYYVQFSAETIREFAQKYLAENRANNVDLAHDSVEIEGAEMVQYFIKDTDKGIAPEGFDEVADGSLFAEYQITDADLWARIQSGEFNGFSVEIIHSLIPSNYKSNRDMKNTLLARVKSALLNAIMEVENETSETYRTLSTDKGIIRWDSDTALEVGSLVYGIDAEENRIDLADGIYKSEESAITIAKGKVTEIADIEAYSALTAFREKVAKFSASYNEKTKAISNAFAKVYGYDFFIADAGDDFAIIEVYEGGKYRLYRYSLTISESLDVTIDYDSKVEVEWRMVPIDTPQAFNAETPAENPAEPSVSAETSAETPAPAEPANESANEPAPAENPAPAEPSANDARVAELEAELASRDAKIAELEARLKEPSAPSAHEAFKSGQSVAENPIEMAKKYISR